MNTFTPFFILSAETDLHTTNENSYRTGMLARQLRAQGFAVAKCKGVYEGRAEAALLVIDETPRDVKTFNIVMRLARTYAQKTVLSVDANRNANLVPTDATQGAAWLGRFVSVTKDVALAEGDYICRADRYYVCR